jgi:hypothetical protein
MRHVRSAKICASGVKGFFDRQPHLVLRDLSNDGIPAEDLIATGDLFAARAVAEAEKEARNG